jgi:hypothetical protein
MHLHLGEVCPQDLVVGMILRITRRMPDNAHVSINAFIIHVVLPALILGQIHGLRLTPQL